MYKKILFLAGLILIILIGKFFIVSSPKKNMEIESVFENNQEIPKKYTCEGEDINPPLTIKKIPKNTKSLVLIVDDPDAPGGTWVHWVVFNIPVEGEEKTIKENEAPGIQGINDFKKTKYGGPCPPSGTHRYFFKAYALNKKLNLPEGVTKGDVIKEIEDSIIEKAELIGLYSKH